jgi:3'(2'), 5'-bisphosphate nucleotidase
VSLRIEPVMSDYSLERRAVCDAVRRAALLCLAVRRDSAQYADSMEKAGHEPVTVADYGAQAVILQYLRESFPDDGVYAEEHAAEFNALVDLEQRTRVADYVSETLGRHVSLDNVRAWLDHGQGVVSRRIWMIDPLDGTKGFLRGDHFAIAVALAVDGVPVVGGLACPLMQAGLVFSAVRGQAATVEPLTGGPAHAIGVSHIGDPLQARVLESVEPAHSDQAFSARALQLADVQGEVVRMDSQAKYAAVASGQAEIYIRSSVREGYRERVWDHAAGALIVEQAGGRVTDLDGVPLDFGLGGRLAANRGVLATNGLLHGALLDALRQVRQSNSLPSG